MTEAVVEALGLDAAFRPRRLRHVTPLLEERTHGPVDLPALATRANHRDRELERLDALSVPIRDRGIDGAHAERPRHVGEARALDVLRKEIAEHGVVVLDAPASRIVTVCSLGAVGDDHVVTAAAESSEGRSRSRAQSLTGQRLAVDDTAFAGRV